MKRIPVEKLHAKFHHEYNIKTFNFFLRKFDRETNPETIPSSLLKLYFSTHNIKLCLKNFCLDECWFVRIYCTSPTPTFSLTSQKGSSCLSATVQQTLTEITASRHLRP